MIKDYFISFRDNFKEKTKNPFLGTYLIVWLIRNWELVYTLFNFDDNQDLEFKINFIKTYYSKNEFLSSLWTNVYWSFGLLILTYLLLNFSRLITNLSEKRLTPWIYKITDSKSIVLKSVFDKIKYERNELQSRLDQERDLKSKLENQIKILEDELTEIKIKNDSEDITIDNLLDEKDKNYTEILYNKLIERNLLNTFKEISTTINKGSFIHNDTKHINDFIELGLIVFEKNSGAGTAKLYKISKYGNNILDKIRFEK